MATMLQMRTRTGKAGFWTDQTYASPQVNCFASIAWEMLKVAVGVSDSDFSDFSNFLVRPITQQMPPCQHA